MQKTILITGGAGYIGSACAEALCGQGYKVVVFDNLSNGDAQYVDSRAILAVGDILDTSRLHEVFAEYAPHIVIHAAALKAVGESEEQPARYFRNNVTGTLNVLEASAQHGIEQFIFSSTASVYKPTQTGLYTEHDAQESVNVYGTSKILAEKLIEEFHRTRHIPSYVTFRYFNVAGDTGIGFLEKDPKNLFPILRNALQTDEPVHIFGDTYKTPDGTCVRDYIHIADIADAHVKAIAKESCGTFNLGTSTGSSVKEIIAMFEQVSGKKLSCTVQKSREGDPAVLRAVAKKVQEELGWEATRSLKEMVASTLAVQTI